ncbi:MAG TPA: leucyl aminopeptidase [Vicinamibacterales bacterium]|jgi:leucyl aminopeptidase|nr:leucyl aminopeptidase [Vicinamibacterales bacterium]
MAPLPAVSPAVALTTVQPFLVDVDLVFVPMFEGEDPTSVVRGLDDTATAALSRAFSTHEIQGRPFELFLSSATGWRAGRLALVGCGRASDASTERLRKAATFAALSARQRRVGRIAFVDRATTDRELSVQAIAEGLVMAGFSADRYKSGERATPAPEQMLIVSTGDHDSAALERAAERGRILGESCNVARELANEPSNLLTPSVFADRAAAIGRSAGLTVQILDEDEIARLQMGLLLGVARGSAEPPRLIVLRHEPPNAPDRPVLGLVGKGITFDTGGISIKPAEGMERMKSDMSGGAAVICAMRAIALLGAPIRVIGVVPATENMPGGKAMKPGDVLTGAGGKTVEVINTDAEGRLVLGDGLWYAQQLGATHLVDVATLTGACVVALGKAAAGLFGQPDAWVELIRGVSARAGDRAWPMPLYDDYADQLRSEVADMMNTGGRPAGACTAAMFLKEFAGGLPWAHLDIAGTSWVDEAKPWQPKGPTGVAVRTLAELAFTSGDWR